jgi:hypothetical protein
MNAYEVAMAIINAFCGGALTMPVSQVANASPREMTSFGHKLLGVSGTVEERSHGVVTASCMTGTGRPTSIYQGQSQVMMNASYNQATDAMSQIQEGLKLISEKVGDVSKFIEKAQKYLKELLEKFRLKIMKLLGSWWGMIVVTVVAFLAVKLVKALVNKVAGKLGAAGAVIRAVGNKWADDIQATLTTPKVPEPKINGVPPSSTYPAGNNVPLPAVSADKLKISVDPANALPPNTDPTIYLKLKNFDDRA